MLHPTEQQAFTHATRVNFFHKNALQHIILATKEKQQKQQHTTLRQWKKGTCDGLLVNKNKIKAPTSPFHTLRTRINCNS